MNKKFSYRQIEKPSSDVFCENSPDGGRGENTSGLGSSISSKHHYTPNHYEYLDDCVALILNLGQICLIDCDDLSLALTQRWMYANTKCGGGCVSVKKPNIDISRFLMNPPANMIVDHINGNRLDDRRANLRVCTQAENARNRRRGSNNTTGAIGVTKEQGKWLVTIRENGRHRIVGRFEYFIEAVIARDRAAIECYGEFAHTNLPRKFYELPWTNNHNTIVHRP